MPQRSRRFAQVLFHSLSIVMPDEGATNEAMQAMAEMSKVQPNCVPVALATATGFVKLNQIPRARTQLKRIQVPPPLSAPRASSCHNPIHSPAAQ
jgi:hypothetical protein